MTRLVLASNKQVYEKNGLYWCARALQALKIILLETLPDFLSNEMDVVAWSGCLDQIISCILN